jgi:hypothetical protein
MEDEADLLSNLCTDLVTLRRFEGGLIHLFRQKNPGSWVSVRELYDRAGHSDRAIKSELTATWLPSPFDSNYAVVLFFDDATKWSLTADYNVTRLLGQQQQSQVAAAG